MYKLADESFRVVPVLTQIQVSSISLLQMTQMSQFNYPVNLTFIQGNFTTIQTLCGAESGSTRMHPCMRSQDLMFPMLLPSDQISSWMGPV